MKPILALIAIGSLSFGCGSKQSAGGSGGAGGAPQTGGVGGQSGAAGLGGSPDPGGADGSGGSGGPGGAAGTTGSGGSSVAAACHLGTQGTGGASPPSCTSNPADYANPFQDPCGPIEDRITNLLSLLTVTEKQSLLGEHQPAITRLGLPGFTTFFEGLHGVGWSFSSTGTLTHWIGTQFPQAFGLAESWDPAVMKTVGDTTGNEARWYNNAQGISALGNGPGIVVRAPLIDLGRDPRWGRTEESYGEDPYLVGELGKGYLAGLNGPDPRYLLAASTLKHWLGNNNEVLRTSSSSNIDARNLHEYYAAPFEATIRDGHAQGIMTAYNKVSGVPAALMPELKSLLIGQWGFNGLISTDAFLPGDLVTPQAYFPNLEQAVAGLIIAGNGTLVQTGLGPSIAAAFTNGRYAVSDLDAALRPVLRARFRVGDLDPASYVPYRTANVPGGEPWNTAAYKARALDVTHKTAVLLKNSAGTLPLNRASITSIAVIGPRADVTDTTDVFVPNAGVVRDWYGGTAPYVVTPRQGIAAKLPGVTVRYAADDTGGAAVAAAAASSVAVVFIGNHPTCNTGNYGVCLSPYEGREAIDRMRIILDPAQATLVQAVAAANPKTIVVLVSSFPIGIGSITASVPAIVHISNSSQELGTAIADVLFGDYNPAGRTNMTWYASEADIPTAITDYDIRKGTTYWYFAGTPLYPFGYGLSYSTFAYANLTMSATSLSAASTAPCDVEVGVDITNGGRAGDEVIQLYVAYPGSALTRPRQQLRGFQRVSFAAGQTQHVSFALRAADLRYWDDLNQNFAVEANKMVEVQVGASSGDIRVRGMLRVNP
jgi:beta-glucosidase